MDHSDQSLYPWRHKAYFIQYDNPLFLRRFLEQIGGDEKISHPLLPGRDSGEYFLYAYFNATPPSYRRLRGSFCPGRGANRAEAKVEGSCIFHSPSAPLGSRHWEFLHTPRCLGNSLAGSFWRSGSRLGGRLLLVEAGALLLLNCLVPWS